MKGGFRECEQEGALQPLIPSSVNVTAEEEPDAEQRLSLRKWKGNYGDAAAAAAAGVACKLRLHVSLAPCLHHTHPLTYQARVNHLHLNNSGPIHYALEFALVEE